MSLQLRRRDQRIRHLLHRRRRLRTRRLLISSVSGRPIEAMASTPENGFRQPCLI
jgi:hypothetical protein